MKLPRHLSALAGRRPGLAAVALFAVLALWLLTPAAVVGAKVLSGNDLLLFEPTYASQRAAGLEKPSNPFLFDAVYVFHPDMIEARDDLRHGRLPVWSPHVGAGEPLLASQQHAALYPGNWPAMVLPFWESLGLIAALKLVFAALGTYLLCRALGLRGPAAAFGAVAYGFSAYLVVWLEHPHANVYALIPWLFLFADRIARRGRGTDVVGFAAASGAAWLGGHPQSVLIAMAAVLPWAVLRLATAPGEHVRARRSGLLAAGLAGGLGVGAVMLLPLAELLSQSYESERGVSPPGARTIYGLAFPELWGRPDAVEIAGGPLNFPERTGYFGVAPILLGLAGLAVRRQAAQLYFAALALAALTVVLPTPLVSDTVRDLPGFSGVNLNRLLILCAFGGAMAGAFGLQALLERPARGRMVAVAALAGALPLLWIAGNDFVLPRFGDALEQVFTRSDTPPAPAVLQFATVLRWGGLAALVVAAMALAWRRPRLAGAAAVAVVAVTAIDLVPIGRGYHPAVEKSVADPPAPAAVARLERVGGGGRMAAAGTLLGPNLAERYGLRDARSHEQPVVERRARLWRALVGGPRQRLLLDFADPGAGKLAALFSVEHVLLGRVGSGAGPGFRPLPDLPLAENRRAHPRAFVAYAWRRADGVDDALAAATAVPAGGLRDSPVIEGAPPPLGAGAGTRATPARVTEDGDTAVSVDVRAARAGQLVLTDTHYPGWRAEVDGEEVPIRPANVAFRAVAVPAGRHTVRFEYEPRSARLGAALSAVSVFGLLAGLLLLRRGRRARAASTREAASGPA